jgi:hypothetical protein
MREQDANASLRLTPDAQDFFRSLVEEVKSSGGFDTSESSEIYVVGLLTEAAQSPTALAETDQPFTERLAQAMNAPGEERFERFRRLGDNALFVTGFFATQLETRGVAPNYVAAVGQRAYGSAASILRRHSPSQHVFDELAGNFTTFVALLRHIADSLFTASVKSDMGVIELYERWHRSRSGVLTKALLELGVLPTKGPSEAN